MTYPPHPGEHNPGYPTSGQPAGWGPPQPPPYPPQPDPTMQYPGPPQPYDPNQQYAPAPQFGFPPPAPPKSKTTPIVVSVVALVLVLCVGVVTSLYLIGKNATDDETRKAVDAAGTAGTRTEATTAPAVDPTTAAPQVTIKITEPAKLGGRPKLTDADFASLTEELRDSLSEEYGGGSSVGAFYGDLYDEDVVIAIAVETDVPLPQVALAGTFAGIGSGGLKVTGLTAAGTGKLGGVAKCGDADAEGVDVAVCSWADEGSIGMIMWYFKKARQVKTEFPKLRAQIETKS
jgi:hypothetical protein